MRFKVFLLIARAYKLSAPTPMGAGVLERDFLAVVLFSFITR